MSGQAIPVAPVIVQDEFRMNMPESFVQDTNMAYRYTYFSNGDKSPLGIAIRYAPIESAQARDKMIDTYFAGRDYQSMEGRGGNRVLCVETVNPGIYLSIYLIRFVVVLEEGGLMFGCFNCSAAYKDEWWPVICDMLKSLERVRDEAV